MSRRFPTMTSFFDEQTANGECVDFVNANYTTGYEDPVSSPSVNYLVSYVSLQLNRWLTSAP